MSRGEPIGTYHGTLERHRGAVVVEARDAGQLVKPSGEPVTFWDLLLETGTLVHNVREDHWTRTTARRAASRRTRKMEG